MAIKKNNITTTQITLPYSDKATIGGKAVTPDPSKFKFGQLGINYLKGSETISIKNTNYEIVEFIPFEQTIKKVKEIIGDIDTAIETEIEEVINEKINDVREEIGDAVNEEKNDRIEADNIINNKITNLQLGKQNKLVKGQNITLTDLSDNTTRIDAEVDPLYIIVSVLPVSGNSNSIYLVSKTTSNENSKNGNNFEEYIWVDDDWEDLGAFEGGSVDLANYYTKSEINNKVSGINSYTVNTKSISGNPVLDGRDVKLDSYQKGVTLSEVIPADTVNQAIGKIEFRVGDYKTQTDNALLGKSSIYHTHDFSGLTEKPTTISGYGITDSLVSSTTFNTHTATTSGSVSHITSDERISWNNKFDKTGGTISGTVTADSFIKENGTNNDILLGDGEIISKDTFASSSHTHTIANVTDLQTTLNNKQNKLVEGKNIILTDDLTANTTTIKAVVDPLYIIVSVLPVSGNSNSIYLVPKTTSNENSKNDFEEYIWVEDDWEDLGVFDGGAVDLTNYYDKHEIGDIVTGINSYTVNSKIISGNPVLDGRDVKLDLYQKGTILSEVSSADTVNQAIGKIEFRVEDYKTQTDDALLDKSPTSHTHTFANLEDKPTTLSGYGITDSLVSSTTFNTHTADTTSHITSTERTTWNGKFDKSGGTINGNIVINGTLTFGESTSNKNNGTNTSISNTTGNINDLTSNSFSLFEKDNNVILLGGGGTKSVSDFQQKLIAGNGITLTPSETGTTINSVQNAGSASLATVGGGIPLFIHSLEHIDNTVKSSEFGTSGFSKICCYSDELDLFVVIKGNNKIATSNNLSTWTDRYTETGYNQIYDIIWVKELQIFVAVGNPNILTSSNGINWVILTSDMFGCGNNLSIQYIIYCQEIGKFLLSSYNSGCYVFITDLVTATYKKLNNLSSQTIRSIKWIPSTKTMWTFLYDGNNQRCRLYYSTDSGNTWLERNVSPLTASPNCFFEVNHNNGLLVLMGNSSGETSIYNIYTSINNGLTFVNQTHYTNQSSYFYWLKYIEEFDLFLMTTSYGAYTDIFRFWNGSLINMYMNFSISWKDSESYLSKFLNGFLWSKKFGCYLGINTTTYESGNTRIFKTLPVF